MNKKYILIGTMLLLAMSLSLSSCVEDEGCNTMAPINEVEISGIEEEYYIVGSETLRIPVTLTGKLSGSNSDQFNYEWLLCNQAISESEHKHELISEQKDLEYSIDLAPGSYRLIFQAIDKETGMKWEEQSQVTVLSQFVRGFYLFGDKSDGTCGLDFVSMIEGNDTLVVRDILHNTVGMKGAQNLVFTGQYMSEHVRNLWAVTESGSYALEYSASQKDFNVLEGISANNMCFPTIPVTKPMKVIDICPHAFGSTNLNMSRSWRILMTENEIFFSGSMISAPEAYGNPYNRLSSGTSVLFKPAPYVFYQGSNYISTAAFYDLTNHRFVRLNSSYFGATNCATYTDSESPFWIDQTNYSPVRDLVYGENGYGNNGYSYALMKDEDGQYYVYEFKIYHYVASGFLKRRASSIDLAVATNFDVATHYAFFSMQPILLYAAGTQLWGYDYVRNASVMLKDFGSEITYLAMDYASNNKPTDVIVATYSEAEKGVVRKFSLADDPNEITLTEHEYQTASYPWKSDLKIVKAEYRNCTY